MARKCKTISSRKALFPEAGTGLLFKATLADYLQWMKLVSETKTP